MENHLTLFEYFCMIRNNVAQTISYNRIKLSFQQDSKMAVA